jgi:uncharacterized protein YlxP (DUF503 family)
MKLIFGFALRIYASRPTKSSIKVRMIPWAQSLKDKRSAVHGLKDRLRSRFNASVAEVAYLDKWQRAVIAVCITW